MGDWGKDWRILVERLAISSSVRTSVGERAMALLRAWARISLSACGKLVNMGDAMVSSGRSRIDFAMEGSVRPFTRTSAPSEYRIWLRCLTREFSEPVLNSDMWP